MSVASHIQALRRKHQDLSDQVEAAQRSPAYPAEEITQMKREKLRLKDEIDRLSN